MAAGLGAVVAGELDELDLVRDRDRSGEVGEEDDARLQERDEQQLAVGVVARDLGAELVDACLQLFRREEDFTDTRVDGYEARSSR